MKISCSPICILSGRVVHGLALGRTVGLPTANIDYPVDKLDLIQGVYATIIEIDGEKYQSITNIGAKPTVDSQKTGIETYILNFDKDIYNKNVTLSVFKLLRTIRKFDSLEQVKIQTLIDEKEAVDFFDNICNDNNSKQEKHIS